MESGADLGLLSLLPVMLALALAFLTRDALFSLILAMAYSINTLSQSLGAPQYILSIASPWMIASLLPVLTFMTGSLISFFTGTAWGTYAIVTPLVMPLAMSFSGDTVSSDTVSGLVLATIGAIVGGGILGDHCSPVSDTTCLSSFGAGSDHMDHVSTQLPYALLCGVLTCIALLVIGVSAG